MSTSTQTGSQNDESLYHGQAKENIETILFDGLIPPDKIDTEERLKELYVRVENWAKDAIAWYLNRKKWRKRFSLATRIFTAVFTIVGGLIPLLIPILAPDKSDTLFGMNSFAIVQLGYVFLALAAGAMTIDRLFDFSTGWMRSMSTATSLQALLIQFQLDWQIIWNKKDKKSESSESAPYEEMLALLKSFCLQFINQISEETENWQAKLKKSLELAEEELKKAKGETGDHRGKSTEKRVNGKPTSKGRFNEIRSS